MNQAKKNNETKFLSSFILLAFALVVVFTVLFVFSPKETTVAESKKTPEPDQSSLKQKSAHTPSVKKQVVSKSFDTDDIAPAPKPIQPKPQAISEDKLQDLLSDAMKLVDNSRPKDAQEILEKILKEYPNNELALTELGMIHLIDYKDPASAMDYLERAIKVNPSNRVVMSELIGVYEDLGQGDKGISKMQSIYEESENPNLAQGIGESLQNQGRSQEAIPYLEKAASEYRDFSSATVLADAYSNSGQFDKAIEARRNGVDIVNEKIAQGGFADHPGEGVQQKNMAVLAVVEELMNAKRFTEAEEESKKLPPEALAILEEQRSYLSRADRPLPPPPPLQQ
jgi:uncharacterized protein HemY